MLVLPCMNFAENKVIVTRPEHCAGKYRHRQIERTVYFYILIFITIRAYMFDHARRLVFVNGDSRDVSWTKWTGN